MSTNWEQLYREGTKPWDKGAAAPPLIEWMKRHPDTLSGRILVPGCGLGHDVRHLAENFPDAEIIGIDISSTALAGAGDLPIPGNASFCEWDLFDLPQPAIGSFDWIWEHTCFCAIEPDCRDEYVEAVHAALRSGGTLLGVFYLDPYDEEHQPGGGPPHGTTIGELIRRFVDSGRFSIVDQSLPGISYPGREGRELVIEMRRQDPA